MHLPLPFSVSGLLVSYLIVRKGCIKPVPLKADGLRNAKLLFLKHLACHFLSEALLDFSPVCQSWWLPPLFPVLLLLAFIWAQLTGCSSQGLTYPCPFRL